MKTPPRPRLAHIVSLIVVFAILASLAMVHTGRIFGHRLVESSESVPGIETFSDGTVVVNTSDFGKAVSGYGGPVPVEIFISNGRIDSIRALPNSETPSFFSRASSGLKDAWNGMPLADAAAFSPDAVSGATYSSEALIANVHAGVSEALKVQGIAAVHPLAHNGWSLAQFAALIVIALAAIVPLFTKNRRYRIVQQLLNVAVLGFWAGTFINYTLMLNVAANGFVLSAASLIAVILFVVAFIYPLFGKMSYYCTWVCPLGSAQELASHLSSRRWHLGPATVKALTWFRHILWAVLLLLLWAGVATAWIDYELFAAFIVESAGVAMLVAGAILIILSVFIPRPYCRFICPTGTLLQEAQSL